MEKQDSVTLEKRKFLSSLSKRKKILIAVIAVLFVFGIFGRGIGFHASAHPFIRAGSGINLAAKDFESSGIVLAEVSAGIRNGYNVTYDALMKEAAKKGADTIINVNISSTGIFNKTWSGSATAIKYMDTVPGETASISQIPGGRGFGRNWF